ncbi:hypothetical protein H310_14648 [Aphanomyces invadans]|uniref:Uncharacterized protein n=1 Tax=Aphanomyces invadans TaxID=157072 RepID=A0A024T994_9STRA|nr:hypothetical protein H310_14648 [Aphanomyces invadans]ETV90613.1 hypothetical protein H310_14648 [Aphanomyces invadans]|eukprot:XP_008880766.1 hypothetical protein H310_14648 [Aphanomyces invadans]
MTCLVGLTDSIVLDAKSIAAPELWSRAAAVAIAEEFLESKPAPQVTYLWEVQPSNRKTDATERMEAVYTKYGLSERCLCLECGKRKRHVDVVTHMPVAVLKCSRCNTA